MSAGPFQITNYITDGGTVIPITIQPETTGLTLGGAANAAPAGTPTAEFGSARVSGGNRQVGLKARSASVRLTAPLTGYQTNSTITLPVLNPTVWAGYAKGQTGTYLGTACICVGTSPERRR